MKSTWLTSCGGISSCKRLQGAKKGPAKGQDQNDLVNRVVLEVLKKNKRAKAMDMHNPSSENEPTTFAFENLSISNNENNPSKNGKTKRKRKDKVWRPKG